MPHSPEITFPMRLNRYLAQKGLATRRQADELIAAGLVSIDGHIAKLGEKVLNTDQVVSLGDEVRKIEKDYRYFAYYKPRGIITHSPQGKEKSIAGVSGLRDMFPVGRLDKDSEGLIILTNDGRITERLLSPRFEHEKEYVVTVREVWPKGVEQTLQEGVLDGGEVLRVKGVVVHDRHMASIILTEGKKHQIRRMLGGCHLTVTELKRIRILNVHLGALASGEKRELTGKAKQGFLHDLGLE